MDLLGIGAAAQAISGVVQGKMNSDTARRNTDMTNQANREMAEFAYDKDLEMWRRGNEYNNPANQMERLKNAGLNPNMIYGSSKAVGNSAGQLPKYNAPKQSFNYQPVVQDLPGVISMYQDFALKNAQIDNMEAQADIHSKEAQVAEMLYGGRARLAAAMGNMRNAEYNVKHLTGDPQDISLYEKRYIADTDYSGERLRAIGADIDKTIAQTGLIGTQGQKLDEDIALKKKLNKLFYWDAASKMGSRLIGMFTGALGKTVGSTLRNFKAPKMPYRYNSTESWRNLPPTSKF